tara:strand:+ start:721 stop:1281 length:561 start_codon:yes stop_codon:yes gene_type:complete
MGSPPEVKASKAELMNAQIGKQRQDFYRAPGSYRDMAKVEFEDAGTEDVKMLAMGRAAADSAQNLASMKYDPTNPNLNMPSQIAAQRGAKLNEAIAASTSFQNKRLAGGIATAQQQGAVDAQATNLLASLNSQAAIKQAQAQQKMNETVMSGLGSLTGYGVGKMADRAEAAGNKDSLWITLRDKYS